MNFNILKAVDCRFSQGCKKVRAFFSKLRRTRALNFCASYNDYARFSSPVENRSPANVTTLDSKKIAQRIKKRPTDEVYYHYCEACPAAGQGFFTKLTKVFLCDLCDFVAQVDCGQPALRHLREKFFEERLALTFHGARHLIWKRGYFSNGHETDRASHRCNAPNRARSF